MDNEEIKNFINGLFTNGRTPMSDFGMSWDDLSTLEFICPETTVRNPAPYRVIEFEFDDTMLPSEYESFSDRIVYPNWNPDSNTIVREKIEYWFSQHHIMKNKLYIRFDGINADIFDIYMNNVEKIAYDVLTDINKCRTITNIEIHKGGK